MRAWTAAVASLLLALAPAPALSRGQAPMASAKPPVTIVAFGDSLTAGLGVAAAEAYPSDLKRDMARDGVRARVVNLGISGDTTTDGLARVAQVEALHPAWVILEFGGNDGLRGVPVSRTEANLQAIIRRLRRDRIGLLLVGMSLPPNYGPEYIHAFQAIYPALARRDHLPLVPFIYEDLAPKLKQDPGLLQGDGIHPTAAGCRIVAATIWRYLRPLLGRAE